MNMEANTKMMVKAITMAETLAQVAQAKGIPPSAFSEMALQSTDPALISRALYEYGQQQQIQARVTAAKTFEAQEPQIRAQLQAQGFQGSQLNDLIEARRLAAERGISVTYNPQTGLSNIEEARLAAEAAQKPPQPTLPQTPSDLQAQGRPVTYSPKVIAEFTRLVETNQLPQGSRISDYVSGRIQPARVQYYYAPVEQAAGKPELYGVKSVAMGIGSEVGSTFGADVIAANEIREGIVLSIKGGIGSPLSVKTALESAIASYSSRFPNVEVIKLPNDRYLVREKGAPLFSQLNAEPKAQPVGIQAPAEAVAVIPKIGSTFEGKTVIGGYSSTKGTEVLFMQEQPKFSAAPPDFLARIALSQPNVVGGASLVGGGQLIYKVEPQKEAQFLKVDESKYRPFSIISATNKPAGLQISEELDRATQQYLMRIESGIEAKEAQTGKTEVGERIASGVIGFGFPLIVDIPRFGLEFTGAVTAGGSTIQSYLNQLKEGQLVPSPTTQKLFGETASYTAETFLVPVKYALITKAPQVLGATIGKLGQIAAPAIKGLPAISEAAAVSEKFGLPTFLKAAGSAAGELTIVGLGATAGLKQKPTGELFYDPYAAIGGIGAAGATLVGTKLIIRGGSALAQQTEQVKSGGFANPFAKTVVVPKQEAEAMVASGVISRAEMLEGGEATKALVNTMKAEAQASQKIGERLSILASEARGLSQDANTKTLAGQLDRIGFGSLATEIESESQAYLKRANELRGKIAEFTFTPSKERIPPAFEYTPPNPKRAAELGIDVTPSNEPTITKAKFQYYPPTWQESEFSLKPPRIYENPYTGQKFIPAEQAGYLTEGQIKGTESIAQPKEAQRELTAIRISLPREIIPSVIPRILPAPKITTKEFTTPKPLQPTITTKEITPQKIAQEEQLTLKTQTKTMPQISQRSISGLISQELVQTQQQTQQQTEVRQQLQTELQTRQQTRVQTSQVQKTQQETILAKGLLLTTQPYQKKKGRRKKSSELKALKPKLVGVIPDVISQIKSEYKYGRSTAALAAKYPAIIKYRKNLIGYVPSLEQIKAGEAKPPFGKKPEFKFRGFKLP